MIEGGELPVIVGTGGGDARNTQDNVGCNDAEHNDLSHVHEPYLSLASTLNQRLRRRITPAVLLAHCP